MIIQKLYDKDIERRINPAVVVSEMEEYFIDQEIDEYVFTQGITKNIYTFLNAIANKKEGKTGVWISGYYGSGKSHFIKYLFYSLSRKYREKAFLNFRDSLSQMDSLDEPNLGMVVNLQKKIDNIDIEEIIFNIDTVSKNNDNENHRITGIFLNKLNEYQGFNKSNPALAIYLEKPLEKKELFQAFKDKIKSHFNEDWDGNQIRFVRRYLDKVIQIAQEFDADIDAESLKLSILDKNQDYTIEFLIDEFQDYLNNKPEDYRLIFLLDEVSQYIGDNKSLLLNLQTIVEEVGAQLGTKVWIVCTAQQDLQTLVDNTGNNTNEFGKILGRFETMISLESQDAAFITKKRVLEKNSEGIGALNAYYKDNKGAIENQFVFDHDLYENFDDREDFTLTYPFIPYQFRLISDVFESFSNVGFFGEGVKNTERAILGITHFTANLCRENELGYFVPFDLFFNQQLEKYLTHHARSIMDRAYHIDQVKSDKFSKRVVNALFMISNLGDSQSVNFPANVENIALLLMSSVDTAKLETQNKVQLVLDILVSKNIIQESEGKYRFLKEDEIDVANLIKNTTVRTENRLEYIFRDILEKTIKSLSQMGAAQLGNKNLKIAISIDDKEYSSKGDFKLKFSIYDNTDIESLAHKVASNDMIIGINEWFKHDNDLKSKVTDYVRTQLFIKDHFANATGTRSETINNFKEKNIILLKEIKLRFEKKFLQTPFISNGQVIYAEDLNGASPSSRFDEMVSRHLKEIYRKNHLSKNYASSNAEFLAQAKSKQVDLIKDLSPAEEEMSSKLLLEGEGPVVGDIVKKFEKAPYGWKDIATLDVLLRLAKKGSRRFEWKNEEIDLVTFANKALNSHERNSITIYKEKEHSQDEIKAFIHTVNNEIFAETLIPSNTNGFKETIEIFKIKLEPKLTKINSLKEEYEAFPFASHLKNFHTSLAEIYNTRNPDKVADMVISKKAQLKQARDTFMHVDEFIEYNFKNYEKINQFEEKNRSNFDNLDENLKEKSEELKTFLKTDHEPWDKFPQMNKVYKELYKAIKDRITSLKEEVINTYTKIFKEIEDKQKELKIESANLTTNAEFYINKINKESQIAQLEIYQLKANDFRASNFKILEEYKAKKDAKASGKDYQQSLDISIAAEMPPTTIATPEQLDEYIKKLRARLMIKLDKNQKIFLN